MTHNNSFTGQGHASQNGLIGIDGSGQVEQEDIFFTRIFNAHQVTQSAEHSNFNPHYAPIAVQRRH